MVEYLVLFSVAFLLIYGLLFIRADKSDVFARLVVGAALWAAVYVTVVAVQGAPSHAPVPDRAILIDEAGPYVWASVDGEPATYLSPDMSQKFREARAKNPNSRAFVRGSKSSDHPGEESAYGNPDDLVPFEPEEMRKE